MALQPGSIVGGYRVVRVLGAGGMGTVYLAQNPILPRRDALKVLSADLSEDAEFRARFEREANLAAALDHPNIVAVYSRGEEAGQLWIAMQYVDGTDAADELAKGRAVMTPPRALRIVTEVGKGLDYAHRRGLLHRDIKPANFLLSRTDDDDEERVLLTDFGVAKSAEDGQDLTETGNFMATVAYAAPEQLLGERLDHRADIYSFGCAFYKLLTGQNVYPATVPAVAMMGHIHEAPPRPSAVRPDLPAALDAVFAKVLAKDPAQRYNTCREFVHDAEIALFGGPRYPAPQSGYPTDPRHQLAPHHQTATHPIDSRPQVDPTATTTEDNFAARLHATVPNGRHSSSPLRKLLLPSLIALIIAVVVATGTYYLLNANGTAPSSDKLAQVRADHPEFATKTVAAFSVSNTDLLAVLDPSDQSKFLQGMGFQYSPEYQTKTGEKSPRRMSLSSSALDKPVDFVIVLRTDSEAGNGGLRGLPAGLLRSQAKIVVIDDLTTVQAFQVWTDQSPNTLIEKLVPAIAKVR